MARPCSLLRALGPVPARVDAALVFQNVENVKESLLEAYDPEIRLSGRPVGKRAGATTLLLGGAADQLLTLIKADAGPILTLPHSKYGMNPASLASCGLGQLRQVGDCCELQQRCWARA